MCQFIRRRIQNDFFYEKVKIAEKASDMIKNIGSVKSIREKCANL
jgi:hypothetical protein